MADQEKLDLTECPDSVGDGETATESAAETTRSTAMPSADALQAELTKERKRGSAFRYLRNTVLTLVSVAAVVAVVTTLVLPVLQISDDSMSDTLKERDVVLSLRRANCETGDVIAFKYNDRILVTRVIAKAGQWVDIDGEGNVWVDGKPLDEPYIAEKALGECSITLPYQVPPNRIFVMGDQRAISIDSRSTAVGCITNEQVVGKLVFCIWPFERFGFVG